MENKKKSDDILIIKRPDDKTDASYLYGVVLRKIDWEKVTMMIRNPDQKMLDRLAERNIKHWIFSGNGVYEHHSKSKTDTKDVKALVGVVEYLNDILESTLTDEQIDGLDLNSLEKNTNVYRKIKEKNGK